MKKIFYSILFVLAGFAFTGCDDLLDTVPKDRLTTDTYFKSEGELLAASIGFYELFPSTSLYIANDDLYTQNNLSTELMGKRTIPASGEGWTWGTLRDINTLLENIDHCSDASVKAKYEALSRFFRAYFYFNKVKRFGDVPWYDAPVGSVDTDALNRPRDSREFIMGKIIEDLDYAIDNLPTTKSAYEVTKWTAMALKSNVLLFEGTFRKYHAGDVFLSTLPADANSYSWYLQECAKVSKEFIQTSGYGLHKSYYELFHTMNATALTDEVILARDFNKAYGAYHNSNYSMTTGSNGCPSMTKKMEASYLMKDGSRFTDQSGWETKDFAAECSNRDPRMAQSIRTPGYKRQGEDTFTAPDLKVTFTGYHPDKYLTTKDQDTWNNSDVDLIIFRAAEVMLNYAEAQAELGVLSQDDLDMSLNQLRDRAGMPRLTMATANANPDPFLTNAAWGGYQSPVLLADPNKGVILEIRRERAVELGQEGHRYYDVMRWKEGKIFEAPFYGIYISAPGAYDLDGDGVLDFEVYTGSASSTAPVQKKIGTDIVLKDGNSGLILLHGDVARTWTEDKDYLYPIPTDDRNLTHGALTQNPGWDDGLTF
ncbi:MAG: RagB/SusD family nutrient uptake outer membrane protein [Bacteroidales bacterium]|nr:RagB/SusD family nutrient uptake outer membrane protein [Bacteroidales bacterium]